GSKRDFRIIHFSIQRDHLHLIVKARDASALARGVQGLGVRAARAVNRALGRRGTVWGDRYHARALATPREVRAALASVLLNRRKHEPTMRGIDPCSSGPWFDGWSRAPKAPRDPSPVAAPRTWLASVGWRKGGLIRVDERVGPSG